MWRVHCRDGLPGRSCRPPVDRLSVIAIYCFVPSCWNWLANAERIGLNPRWPAMVKQAGQITGGMHALHLDMHTHMDISSDGI
jgi:hypothetical protein